MGTLFAKVRQARELSWLLNSLQSTLQSLKAGLLEASALLAPTEPGATLVLSSHRSESVKGTITRVGTRIVKGSLALRLQTLPPPRGSPAYPLSISSAPQAPTLVLDQLVTVRTGVNTCLDIVDVSTWTGDKHNANFIAGQLKLLEENIKDAKGALKGGEGLRPWCEEPADESVSTPSPCRHQVVDYNQVFDPPLPHSVSFNLSIAEAAIVLTLRTLAPATPRPSTPDSSFIPRFNLGDRLAVALGATKLPTHDETDQTFNCRGEEVTVKEKVRVESQDPNLMAALAKLGSLERVVRMSRQALATVMGKDMSDED